jgi:hypothetical protein
VKKRKTVAAPEKRLLVAGVSWKRQVDHFVVSIPGPGAQRIAGAARTALGSGHGLTLKGTEDGSDGVVELVPSKTLTVEETSGVLRIGMPLDAPQLAALAAGPPPPGDGFIVWRFPAR